MVLYSLCGSRTLVSIHFFSRTRRNQLISESTPFERRGQGPSRRVFEGRGGIGWEEMSGEPFGYLRSDFSKGVCARARAHPRAPPVCASEVDLRAGKHRRERQGEREGRGFQARKMGPAFPAQLCCGRPGHRGPGAVTPATGWVNDTGHFRGIWKIGLTRKELFQKEKE